MAKRRLPVVGGLSSDSIREASRKVTTTMLSERTPIAEMGAELAAFVSDTTEQAMAKVPPSKPIDCKAGCVHCCHLKIVATPVEVLAIGSHLKRRMDSGKLSRLKRAIRDLDTKTRGLTTEARAALRLPCPLLDAEQRCAVYETRPLRCAGANSYSADQCKRAFDAAGAEDLPIEHYGPQRRTADALSQGVAIALAEHRLDNRLVELVAALRVVLEDTNALSKWQRGERVFESAVDTESRG